MISHVTASEQLVVQFVDCICRIAGEKLVIEMLLSRSKPAVRTRLYIS